MCVCEIIFKFNKTFRKMGRQLYLLWISRRCSLQPIELSKAFPPPFGCLPDVFLIRLKIPQICFQVFVGIFSLNTPIRYICPVLDALAKSAESLLPLRLICNFSNIFLHPV